MPDTRSGKTSSKPLTEGEIETIQAKLNEKDERLRVEAALLKEQREEYEENVRKLIQYREQTERDMEARKQDTAGKNVPQILNDDVLREIEQLRREVEHLRRENRQTPRHSGQDLFASDPYNDYQHDSPLGSGQLPKVSFREATDSVPSFDGYNIPLSQFNKACRRAKEIIPPSAERNLTKLLINKLRGRAYSAVEDEPCDSITQLIDLLTAAFGSRKTIDQYRGELSMIHLKPQEHILDYISRVKELRAAILDAERRETGIIAPTTETEVDLLTGRSFCKGLPLEYRLQIKESLHHRPFEAFSAAKVIAKEQELDKIRFGTRDRQDRDYENRGANYTRRQLTYTAPPQRRYDDPRPDHAMLTTSSRANYPRMDRSSYGHQRSDRPQPNYPRAETPRNTSRYPERGRNEYPRNTFLPNNNNHPADTSRDSPPRTANRADVSQEMKQCRYCKNYGHEINECRKRAYNNARQNDQGNPQGPARPTGDARQGPTTREARPVNPITVSPAENIE